MQTWVIIIIIVACLIVLYLIIAVICYFLLKRARLKAYDEMQTLIPYEKERLDVIIKAKDALLDDNRHFPNEMAELVQSTEDILSTNPVDVGKAKGQSDFLIIYFTKYIKEKKLIHRGNYQEIVDELNAHLHMEDDEKNSPYRKYNKKAMSYNAYLNLIFIPGFIRRKYQQAPIL